MTTRIALASGVILAVGASLFAQKPAERPDAPTNRTATEPPSNLSDCANDGWRTYSGPVFKNQKACERWVRKHANKTGAATPHPGAANPTQAVTPAPNP